MHAYMYVGYVCILYVFVYLFIYLCMYVCMCAFVHVCMNGVCVQILMFTLKDVCIGTVIAVRDALFNRVCELELAYMKAFRGESRGSLMTHCVKCF